MHWTVQVIVALLNIVWIVFFLQEDPFPVSVQRRSSDSSDDEMLFGEFCIQPQPDMKWTSAPHSVNITTNTTNSTNTTAEAKSYAAPVTPPSVLRTPTQHPAEEEEEEEDAAPITPPSVLRTLTQHSAEEEEEEEEEEDATSPTPPSVFSTPAQHSTEGEEDAAPVTPPSVLHTPTQHSTEGEEGIFLSKSSSQGGLGSCCWAISATQVPRGKLRSYYIQLRPLCPIHAVVFTTVKGKRICSDPHKPWTRTSMAYLDGKN